MKPYMISEAIIRLVSGAFADTTWICGLFIDVAGVKTVHDPQGKACMRDRLRMPWQWATNFPEPWDCGNSIVSFGRNVINNKGWQGERTAYQ
jgi:hypothetical protein